MKKKILLIVALAILIIAIATTIVVVLNNKKDDTTSLLDFSTKSEVESLIEAEKIEGAFVTENYTSIETYEILNTTAKVEIIYSEDESFYSFRLLFDLFTYEFTDGEQEYKFTSKDKEKIEKQFNEIKTAFGEYLGCELQQYDVVPARELEKLEDTDEAFYKGDIVREYSVRDVNGTLWILVYEASNGTASATIEKVLDEGKYMDFIPSIDLTK